MGPPRSRGMGRAVLLSLFSCIAVPCLCVTELPSQLEVLRLSAPYRERLARGLADVEQWRCMKFPSKNEWMFSVHEANVVLVDYVNAAWESGRPFWLIKHGVLAVQHQYHWLRNHLRRPWDALRSWHAMRPRANRRPLTADLVGGSFSDSTQHGVQVSP